MKIKLNSILKLLPLLALLVLAGTKDAQANCWCTWGVWPACGISGEECDGYNKLISKTVAQTPADPEKLIEMCPDRSPGQSSSVTGDTDPVDFSTGQFHYNCAGLKVPGRKIDFDSMQTYSSGSSFNGPFGYGWALNYYKRLHRLRNGDAVIVSGVGKKVRYIWNGSVYNPPAGRFERLVKNGNNTWTLTLAHGERYQFDTTGKLTAIEDRNNNTITFAYSANKEPHQGRHPFGQNPLSDIVLGKDYRLTSIIDTTGRTFQLNYNADGLLETIVDGSRQIALGYDSNTNDLLTATQPATAQFPSGVVKTFVYENHNVKKIKDAKNQFFVENFYDAQGRVAEQVLGGNSISLAYSVPSQVTETDRNENVTTYIFNADGTLNSKKQFTRDVRASEPPFYLTTYAYNADSMKISETFPKGNGVLYAYDSANGSRRARGNLLQLRRKTDMTAANNDTNDIVVNLTYEPQFNQVRTVTDPKGKVSALTYDYELSPSDPDYGTKGNLVEAELPAVTAGIPVTKFSYNSFGQVTKTIDPNGQVTQYEYFPVTGYLKKIIRDPLGINAVTEFAYDAFGNLDTVTDAENRATDYDYDELGWLRKVTNPLDFEIKYTHDANGNVTKIERQASDPAGTWQTTQFTYDILNNLKTVTDPLNRLTTYNYDDNENRSSVVDAETNTTAYVYDERDLLFTVTDANNGVTRNDYDINGNLSRITDANTNQTNYQYDLFDRLDITQYADLSSSNFDFDKNSNLDFVTLPGTHGTIDYVYDELNRLLNKNFPSHASLNSTYVYDLGGRMTDADNAAADIHYVYDNLNRVDTVTHTLNATNYTLDYDYYKNGLRKQLVYPSAKTLDYIYDANNRLDIVKLNTVNFADYNYDPLDRRIQKSFLSSTLPLTTYNYDLANQLADITNKLVNNTAISKYEHPLYDAVGNRKQLDRTLGANPAATINYTYNNIYELTGVTGAETHDYTYDSVGNRTLVGATSYTPNNLNQYTAIGGNTPTYDNNGNLAFDGVAKNFVYDEQNRLKSFDTTGTSNDATYAYDALNRRVSKTVDGTTTYFVYDGDDIIADYDGSGSLDAEYIHGGNVDEILAMERGVDMYYYHADGLGSVTEITDATGVVAENYTYDPYGNPSVLTSSIGNRYRFTGREFDEESGIYHYRARAYDPTIGRFLQRDPLGYEGGMNSYEYAYNSSANFVDPDGELAFLALVPLAYAAIEIGLAAMDAYSTGSTLLDPCASGSEKAVSAGLFLAGALAPGGGYSTAGKALAKNSDIFKGVPLETFRGTPKRRVLQSDVTAYRFSGGTADSRGQFLTTRQTLRQIGNSADAQKVLNLPPTSTAEKLNQFTIPKGTEVFIGRVEGGASGATQIFIRNKDFLR